jgi:hypothetical protein
MDVDEILKELVERKTRMQSYTPFNLDATVTVRMLSFALQMWGSSQAKPFIPYILGA